MANNRNKTQKSSKKTKNVGRKKNNNKEKAVKELSVTEKSDSGHSDPAEDRDNSGTPIYQVDSESIKSGDNPNVNAPESPEQNTSNMEEADPESSEDFSWNFEDLDQASDHEAVSLKKQEALHMSEVSRAYSESSDISADSDQDSENDYWKRIASGYEREAKALGKNVEAAAIWHEAGFIYQERLDNRQRAVDCYQSAVEACRNWRPNLQSAKFLFSEVGNWPAISRLLEAEIEATSNAGIKSDLLLELSIVLREKLSKASDSSKHLSEAQQLSPENLPVLKYMEGLAARDRNSDRLAEILELEADSVDSPKLKGASLALAAILNKGSENDKSIQLLHKAVEISPPDKTALEELDLHLSSRGLHDERLDILGMLAKTASGPEELIASRLEASRLLEDELGRSDEALSILETTLGESPHISVLQELAERYDNNGNREQMAEILVRLAELTKEPNILLDIHLKLGSLFEEFGRSEDSIKAYRKALEIRPGDSNALAALGKLYFREEKWQELIWTFEQEILSAPDKLRALKKFKIAEIQEHSLSDVNAAIITLQEILKEHPGFHIAVQSLIQLLDRTGRWEELVSLLESEASSTDAIEQKITYYERIARVCEERMDDLTAASEALEKALVCRGDHLPTIRNLGHIYRRLARWSDLVRILELEYAYVEDQRQVVSLLFQVAEIYDERLQDFEAAIENFKKVVALQPDYLPALKALGRLCGQAGKWQELMEIHRMELEIASSPDHATGLLMKIGEICEKRLNNDELAISTYNEVLEYQPQATLALQALERLYRKQKDWNSVISLLERQAESISEPIEKALVLTRKARILEFCIKDPVKACAVYEAALEVYPEHAYALRAIEKIHTSTGAWQSLAHFYSKIAATSKTAVTNDINRKLGLLYLYPLQRHNDAKQCLEKVMDSISDDHVSLSALDILYTESGRHDLAFMTRSLLASHLDSEKTATDLLFSTAIAQYYLLAPGTADESVWEKIHASSPEWITASRHMEKILRNRKDIGKLTELLNNLLAVADGDDIRTALHMRIGEIALESDDSVEIAEESFNAVLELLPNHMPAIRGFRRVMEKKERWSEYQSLLEREGMISKDPDRAQLLLLEAGILSEEHLNDPESAERTYRKVLDNNSFDRQAYLRLAGLLKTQERYEELIELHKWRAEISTESIDEANVLIATAKVYCGPLNELRTGLGYIEKALRIAPKYREALDLGIETTIRLEEWENAAILCREIIDIGENPDYLAKYRLLLAKLLHEHLDDKAQALEALRSVLLENPNSTEALRRKADIHLSTEEWSDAMDALSNLAASETEEDIRTKTLMELATVQFERLDDPSFAISTLEDIISSNPTHEEATLQLASLYESVEQWGAAERTYTGFLTAIPAEKKELSYPFKMKAAALQSGPLQDPDKAIETYRAAIEIKPDEIAARAALADLLTANTSTQAQAIEEHRKILSMDPFRLESYHVLFNLFGASKALDRAWIIASILHFFDACTKEEERFYKDMRKTIPKTIEGSLSDEDLNTHLRHKDESGILADIMQTIGNQLSKVYPPDLARFQVGRAERLTPRDDSPLRKMCDSLAFNLGGLNFELYRADKNPDALESFAADPPVLIVGPDLIRQHSIEEQKFLIARHISRMYFGTCLFAQTDTGNLASAIQAAIRYSHPNYSGMSEITDPKLTKQCGKSMARKARKALDIHVQALMQQEQAPDFDKFNNGVRLSSDRTGILLSGDIKGCLNLLADEISKQGGKTPTTELRGIAPFEELLHFILSEPFFYLRRQLKLSL